MKNPNHGGRPASEELKIARLLGDRTYHGNECRNCGCTERYTANSSCVQCARQRSLDGTAARHAAEARLTVTRDNFATRDSEAIDGTRRIGAVSPSHVNSHIATEGNDDNQNTVDGEDGFGNPVNRNVKMGFDVRRRDNSDDLSDLLGESLSHVDQPQRVTANPTDDGLTSAPEEVYLRQDEIPQPWD